MRLTNLLSLSISLLFYLPYAHAEDCTPLAKEPQYGLQQCQRVKVLYLRGTGVERARTIGRLMKEGKLSSEVVNYFSNKIQDSVREQSPLITGPFTLIYNQIVRVLHRAAPSEITEESNALAEAMGVPAIQIRRALTLADMGSLLNALGSHSFFRSLPAAGCTAIAVQEKNGKFVFGRNLDFAGARIWDKHPLITVNIPPSGELKYASIGADGLLYGGITGVNEAGIAFSVQQNYARDASFYGVPMVYIGDQVLRKARSLEDAIEIMDKLRPAPLWTFMVVNLRTGEAATVSSSTSNFVVRRMEEGKLVQTNHILDSNLRENEFISVGTKMNSIYRMKKVFELLEANSADGATPELIAKILSHQEDPKGQLSAYHDVLKGHTVQTAIFEAKNGSPLNIFVSNDEAPTSGGTYLSFSFEHLFSAPSTLQFVKQDLPGTPLEKRARQKEISEAFHIYFDQHNPTLAAEMLQHHETLDNALFQSVVLYQSKRFEESHARAERALRDPRFLGEPAYIRQSLQWVQLLSLIQMDKEENAKQLAREILSQDPPNLRLKETSALILAGKKLPRFFLRLKFEFFSGDLSGRAS